MFIQLSNNSKYHLNIDNIVKYCSSSNDEKATQSDITELYRQGLDSLELIQKQINTSSIKNGQLNTIDTYRYDLVKGLLQVVFDMGFNNDGNRIIKDCDLESVTTGQAIVWNTLLAYEFLEETN